MPFHSAVAEEFAAVLLLKINRIRQQLLACFLETLIG